MSAIDQVQDFVGRGLRAQASVNDALDVYELQAARAVQKGQEKMEDGRWKMEESKRARTLNPTRFINGAAVRQLALETAKAVRPFHKFNRVSRAFLVEISEEVRRSVIAKVKRLPSKGKTI